MKYWNHMRKADDIAFVCHDDVLTVHASSPDLLTEWEDYFADENSMWKFHLTQVTPFESLIHNYYVFELIIEGASKDEGIRYRDALYDAQELEYSITAPLSVGG